MGFVHRGLISLAALYSTPSTTRQRQRRACEIDVEGNMVAFEPTSYPRYLPGVPSMENVVGLNIPLDTALQTLAPFTHKSIPLLPPFLADLQRECYTGQLALDRSDETNLALAWALESFGRVYGLREQPGEPSGCDFKMCVSLSFLRRALS